MTDWYPYILAWKNASYIYSKLTKLLLWPRGILPCSRIVSVHIEYLSSSASVTYLTYSPWSLVPQSVWSSLFHFFPRLCSWISKLWRWNSMVDRLTGYTVFPLMTFTTPWMSELVPPSTRRPNALFWESEVIKTQKIDLSMIFHKTQIH